MGNINQPITRHLINDVQNKDWGLFLDGTVNNLFFKKRGTIIPKTGTTLRVSDYDPGKYAAKFIEITKRPIAEGYPFEIGLTFVRNYKNPGVHNNEVFSHQQYYGGKVLATRAMVNGVISDVDVQSIEDQIIALAKLHALDNVQDKAFVNLRRAYKFVDTDPTDASGFTVTLEDGTTVVFATATTFAAGQAGIQFNALATVNTKLVAIRTGTHSYIITSVDPFYNFSLSAPVDGTLPRRFIYAENVSLDYKIDIQYNQNDCTVSGAFLQVLNAASITTTACTQYVNGVSQAIAGNTTLATLVGQFATAGSAAGVFAISDKDSKIWIYAPGTLNSFDLVLGDTNTMTKVKECAPSGGFAFLTSADVFRTFMNRPADGILANQTYRTQAIDGGVYRKYILTTVYTQDAVGGAAGGKENVEFVFEFFVLKSAALALKFKLTGTNYMDDTLPVGANVSLDTLIRTTLFA